MEEDEVVEDGVVVGEDESVEGVEVEGDVAELGALRWDGVEGMVWLELGVVGGVMPLGCLNGRCRKVFRSRFIGETRRGSRPGD